MFFNFNFFYDCIVFTFIQKIFFLFVKKIKTVANPRLHEVTKEILSHLEHDIVVYEARIFYIDCALEANRNSHFVYFLEPPLVNHVLRAEKILNINALLHATPDERNRIVQLVGKSIILDGKKQEAIVNELGEYADKDKTCKPSEFISLAAYSPSFGFLSYFFSY